MGDKFEEDLEFEWDAGNREKNWEKHGIGYKEVEEVFGDKYSYTSEDIKHSKIEKRYQILGIIKVNNKLSVIFTARRSKIRIISARLMNKREKTKYENEKQKIIANS